MEVTGPAVPRRVEGVGGDELLIQCEGLESRLKAYALRVETSRGPRSGWLLPSFYPPQDRDRRAQGTTFSLGLTGLQQQHEPVGGN